MTFLSKRLLPIVIVMAGINFSAAEDVVTPAFMPGDSWNLEGFDDLEPVLRTPDDEGGARTTETASSFVSKDEKFSVGLYRVTGEHRFVYDEPYGVDEYFHVYKGSITLISSDGNKTVVGPGDAVTIPKEWTGIWESPGYTKLYVIGEP